MAMYQTVCMECWECKQNCTQMIDNIKDSGNDGFKPDKYKEYQARNVKSDKV